MTKKVARGSMTLSLCLALLTLGLVIILCSVSSSSLQAAGGKDIVPPHVPTDTVVLAHYMAWFGLESHVMPPPYVSTDTHVISTHIALAKQWGIDGFVIDWYGPGGESEGLAFIDLATQRVFNQAEAHGDFNVALMYDEGAVWEQCLPTTVVTCDNSAQITTATVCDDCTGISDQVKADLLYAASRYLTSTAYLTYEGKPVLFVFPKEPDYCIDWASVKNALTTTLGSDVLLVDKDPNPTLEYCEPPTRENSFDGFFAWVVPGQEPTCTGTTEPFQDLEYLDWFSRTMKSFAYASRLTVGAVWPGFSCSAPWCGNGCIHYRCGQTWWDTWARMVDLAPPFVQIVTWNDFEEGTDIERGLRDCTLYLPLVLKGYDNYSAVPGQPDSGPDPPSGAMDSPWSGIEL